MDIGEERPKVLTMLTDEPRTDNYTTGDAE